VCHHEGLSRVGGSTLTPAVLDGTRDRPPPGHLRADRSPDRAWRTESPSHPKFGLRGRAERRVLVVARHLELFDSRIRPGHVDGNGERRWKRVVVDPFRTYASTGVFAPDGSISFYETPTDRETYRPADGDHVHFIGEKSTDGGHTWRVLFDATYARQQ